MNDLCVIVVSHNGRHWLEAAIGSVLERSGSIDLDVVVVDNGSDGSAEYMEERFPQVRALRCENRGFGHANNRGLEIADARYVLFLNPDTEVLEGTFAELVEIMDRRADVAVAGVRQIDDDDELAFSIRRFPSLTNAIAESLGVGRLPFSRRELGEQNRDADKYARETLCDWVSGSFMLTRREALDGSGWFDERFFVYSEEVDLCLRFRRDGWEVLHLPDMTIRHYESDTLANPLLQGQMAYAHLQFARKHFSRLKQSAYRLCLACRFALRVGLSATLRRRDDGRHEAMRDALSAVLTERSPFDAVA